MKKNQQGFAAPRKSLGQNFLQDPNIIRKIVESVAISGSDTVIEIGPGRGALTEQILQKTQDCHVIEFDRDLVAYWQDRANQIDNLTVHASDVLKFDLSNVIRSAKGKIKVVGNLPYNISSPVLFYLMKYAEVLESQTLMLQKEVVERMCAEPGNKIYGRLSVMLQQRYKIDSLFIVPPTAFFPPPKVDSAIAQLTLLQSPIAVKNPITFEKLVKQAFAQRRKTLRNNLKGLLTAEQIESLKLDPSSRAETLSVTEFVDLANLCRITDVN
ncbi:MAG: 16S rRNA (adenine(1518)-N(6)/adenine(1519)-N(6))-dimethyltransferase RsmA [Acidiferrobacterales bacterium]|nr:16S rRNA (adenine(1518)-N(6)/adenine(1519)-N(6))-dimethyltransferase RsmA [Acidiferrobacterales bacterium]